LTGYGLNSSGNGLRSEDITINADTKQVDDILDRITFWAKHDKGLAVTEIFKKLGWLVVQVTGADYDQKHIAVFG
jgi:hypothetical protein